MTKNGVIRTIYLYLFTLLGLVLITIGSVRFIDMALKAWVFKLAEEEERLNYNIPPYPAEFVSKMNVEQLNPKKSVQLTQEEIDQLKYLISDYKNWKEQRDKVDPVLSHRHQNASINLALMLVGLPLYLYHWRVIKKETRDNKIEVLVS
ncbi:hypothetical protein HZB94_04200 [Candidatus Falkowbacteria bacterium]|nr:hypothetical protein [Candidatus Falkowbacteria bacterium]